MVENVLFLRRAMVDDVLFLAPSGREKGTSVRTPISRQTSVISDHMRLFHGATAPSSIVSESSGTSDRHVHRANTARAAASWARAPAS